MPKKFKDKIRATTFLCENIGQDVKILVLDVKILVPDVKVLVPDVEVLVPGCVKLCPEMLIVKTKLQFVRSYEFLVEYLFK
jgi:hypothetical protein